MISDPRYAAVKDEAAGDRAAPGRPDRLPIGPRHVLFALLALIALTGLAFGPIGHQVDEGVPERETHPWFPDHFWPYPVLAMVTVAVLGLLAVAGQPLIQLGPAADPRAVVIAHPDWYFLFLFQLLKLGPALVTSVLIPLGAVAALLLWPLIDARFGPGVARRFGWRAWPVPGRNVITGTLWLAGAAAIIGLTVWALLQQQV